MSSPKPIPDVIVGHHPDHGIVATTPTPFAAGRWMLDRLGFRPLADSPDLFALDDQEPDGSDRATRAVALLRTAGYRVDADIALDPEHAPPSPQREPTAPCRVGPDIAFAEQPRLGLVAATTEGVPEAHTLLDAHGWQHHPRLDIYTLPAGTDRPQALTTLAATTAAAQRAGLQAAVQPRLASAVADHRLNQAATARGPANAPSAISASARDQATRPSRSAAAQDQSRFARASAPAPPSAAGPLATPARTR
jgi:hypothetical protein